MFSKLLNARKISFFESYLNDLYNEVIRLDELFVSSGGTISQTGAIEKLRVSLDILWERYWELNKLANSTKISYIGVGRNITIEYALQHFLALSNSVVQKKYNQRILSNSWAKFIAFYEINR